MIFSIAELRLRLELELRLGSVVICGAIHRSEVHKLKQYLPSQLVCGDLRCLGKSYLERDACLYWVVWISSPAKSSCPWKQGMLALLWIPTQTMTASNTSVTVSLPSESIVFLVVSAQWPPASDRCSTDTTSASNRIYCSNRKWSAYKRKYSSSREWCM